MIETPDIVRPPKYLAEGLAAVGSATSSAELSRMGIRRFSSLRPRTFTPGRCIAGPALTLQFMPIREDLYGGMNTRTGRSNCTAIASTIPSPATSSWWMRART